MAYKGLLMIAVPLILLLIFVGLVVHVKHQSESAQVLALHSTEVIGVSQSLLTHIAETESAVRGYVITGDDTFVASYDESLAAGHADDRAIAELWSATTATRKHTPGRSSSSTAQRMDRLSEMFRLIKSRQQERRRRRTSRRETGPDLMNRSARKWRCSPRRKNAWARSGEQALDTSWQRLSWLLVAGTAGAILLASILTLSFSGGISRRLQQLRDNAISLAAGKELAPPLTGHDEIAELDRVFHEMAESLDEVTRREKAVIEGTTDGIFVKDLEHRFLMINQAGADLLGKTGRRHHRRFDRRSLRLPKPPGGSSNATTRSSPAARRSPTNSSRRPKPEWSGPI